MVSGQWLNGINTVEDALRGELRHARYALLRAERDPAETERGIANALAIDNWIKGPLTKYLKRDFASEGDPIRKLADQGILHVSPEQLNVNPEVLRADPETGLTFAERFPSTGQVFHGKSPMAKAWEVASDESISEMPAKFAQGRTIENNPWISKIPPETPVYSMLNPRSFVDDTGLEHLTDEMYNSLSEGRITPQQLNNGSFSVEAAVRHVAERDALAQKEAQKAQLDAMKGAITSKEYPNGYRWAEIPDTSDPEAMKLCNAIGKAGGWCTQDDWAAQSYGSNGGKLHVLLDKDGRPHAQVQESRGIPESQARDYVDMVLESIEPKLSDRFTNFLETDEPSVEQSLRWILKNVDDVDTAPRTREILDQLLNVNGKPSITQIKPMANSWDSQMARDRLAKDPEYRNTITPMLQDFVRSGEWGDVSDLSNARLYHKSYLTPTEASSLPSETKYLTMDEVKKFRKGQPWTPIDDRPELDFANGGMVNFDDLDSFLRR